MTHLRSLASSADRESEVLRKLWLELLPVYLQSTMTALLEDSSLDRAALVVSKIVARVCGGANPLSATISPSRSGAHKDKSPERYPTSRPVYKCFTLKDRVRVPTPRVVRKPRPGRASSPAHVCRPSASLASSDWQAKPVSPCGYHRPFGPDAQKCC